MKTSQELFEIAGIGIHACTTLIRHGLADMFKNTGRFTDHSNCNGYSCHQVCFRIHRCKSAGPGRPNGHVHTSHNEMAPALLKTHAVPNTRRDINKQFQKNLLQKDKIFVRV